MAELDILQADVYYSYKFGYYIPPSRKSDFIKVISPLIRQHLGLSRFLPHYEFLATTNGCDGIIQLFEQRWRPTVTEKQEGCTYRIKYYSSTKATPLSHNVHNIARPCLANL